MSDDMPEAGPDVVRIGFTADGEDHHLASPTPRIAYALSRRLKGIDPLLAGIRNLDLDVYVELLAVVCPTAPGASGKDGREALEAFVYRNLPALIVPATQYVLALGSGGRPLPAGGEAGPADGGPADGGPEGNGGGPGAMGDPG